MSQMITFSTKIVDREVLAAACDKLREDGFDVVGPHYKTDVVRSGGGVIDGYAVKLPGWLKECVFPCDGSADFEADNYSEFVDCRPVNASTGERISLDADGVPYEVHPDVQSGKQRCGADGRWGDIKELDRLNIYYRVAALEQANAGTQNILEGLQIQDLGSRLEATLEIIVA